MIELNQGTTSEIIIVTLTEAVTLLEPYYLFVFTHVTTKNIITFIKSIDDDESDYPERFNQFTIDTSVVFNSQPPGEWHYTIYEQESNSNTDPVGAAGILEYGKMYLLRTTPFEFSIYDKPVTFKTYNG